MRPSPILMLQMCDGYGNSKKPLAMMQKSRLREGTLILLILRTVQQVTDCPRCLKPEKPATTIKIDKQFEKGFNFCQHCICKQCQMKREMIQMNYSTVFQSSSVLRKTYKKKVNWAIDHKFLWFIG